MVVVVFLMCLKIRFKSLATVDNNQSWRTVITDHYTYTKYITVGIWRWPTDLFFFFWTAYTSFTVHGRGQCPRQSTFNFVPTNIVPIFCDTKYNVSTIRSRWLPQINEREIKKTTTKKIFSANINLKIPTKKFGNRLFVYCSLRRTLFHLLPHPPSFPGKCLRHLRITKNLRSPQ